MKDFFRQLFWPILHLFEAGEAGNYNYRPMHRKVLLIMGFLFLLLATVSLYFGLLAGQIAALIPVVMFFGAGLVCALVGLLGSEKAVARIRGNIIDCSTVNRLACALQTRCRVIDSFQFRE